MILTDYYKAEKMTAAKSRLDVTHSTGEHDMMESLLINKRSFNVGGLSMNLVQRPDRWGGRGLDLAITKGSTNLTSIKRPDPTISAGFGDLAGTRDAVIILFSEDYQETGIQSIELFVGRGLKHDANNLFALFTDGELDTEIQDLKGKAVTRIVTSHV
jgi:hypothetical protein